ncbi:MAG TPA: acyltransferase [Caulobacteraceae bacterium]|nr:acyltransferase [Caulobacteraceae bacterium]
MAVAELIDVDSGAAPVSAKRFYRPELDVLRLVAFSLVFMAHLLPRTTGAYQGHLPNTWARVAVAAVDAANFGLPLFFFLSAFLITELLFREQDKSGTVSIKDFAIRRTLRIWPLYLVGLGIGTAYLLLMKSHGGEPGSALMLVMYTVMLGNWYFAAGGRQWPSNPVTPLWSISVEEQFYAIWPVLIKIGGRGSAIIASLCMLAVAVGVEGYLGAKGADPDVVVWTNTFVQFEFFACGVIFPRKSGRG